MASIACLKKSGVASVRRDVRQLEVRQLRQLSHDPQLTCKRRTCDLVARALNFPQKAIYAASPARLEDNCKGKIRKWTCYVYQLPLQLSWVATKNMFVIQF